MSVREKARPGDQTVTPDAKLRPASDYISSSTEYRQQQNSFDAIVAHW
jgi:hypothetical protein